ncbi:hypothetical protein HK100_004094 [Physocladia obscura]|uniref:Uncharacterized protein n=1 Tax=Physocladia obscura TaxID=109957 RepID=A0AAD5T6E7_9FUNG|nr:hypothetical protein HK100_004094 [Physocladia obscura]
MNKHHRLKTIASTFTSILSRVLILVTITYLYKIDRSVTSNNNNRSTQPASKLTAIDSENNAFISPPLISIPSLELGHPYASVFHHPYSLLLATRKCTHACSFVVAKDIARNASFMQNGMDHLWIDAVKDADVMHGRAAVTLWSFEDYLNLAVEGGLIKMIDAVAIPVPEQREYTHVGKRHRFMNGYMHGLDENVPENEGNNKFQTLNQSIQAILKKSTLQKQSLLFILFPTALPEILSLLPRNSVQSISITRLSHIFATPKEFIAQIIRHSSNLQPRGTLFSKKSTFAKRENKALVIGLANCRHIPNGVAEYISDLLQTTAHVSLQENDDFSSLSNEFAIKVIDKSANEMQECLPGMLHTQFVGNNKERKQQQQIYYANIAHGARAMVLFLDAMEGSAGGAVVPDLIFQAMTWNTVIVIVSRYDHRALFPCRECILWINPRVVEAAEMRKRIEGICGDQNIWDGMMAWRGKLVVGEMEHGELFAADFYAQWNSGIGRGVCRMCEIAMKTVG